MAVRSAEYAQSRYDEVASDYDRLWTIRMQPVQDRLTSDLRLQTGDSVADIACGTGAFTLDMARLVYPGDVVAVDYSENMLEAARERCAGEGIPIRLVHATAEDFVHRADNQSYDAISLRFVLAYVDWRDMLPRIGRLLAPGGRVGVLTSTTASIPQAYQVYEQLRESPRTIWRLAHHFRKDVSRAWKMYRHLKQSFGNAKTFVMVPETGEQVAGLLEQGGLKRREAWTQTVRLWFPDGHAAVHWLVQSGYAAHPALQYLGPDGMRFLEHIFASGMEQLREAQGIPLDVIVTGVVAERV